MTEWHPLPLHMLDVSAVAMELLRRRPGTLVRIVRLSRLSAETVTPWLSFLVALHDLGKFDLAFQGKVPEVAGPLLGARPPPPERFRHDVGGLLAWKEIVRTSTLGRLPLSRGGRSVVRAREAEPLLRPWWAATCGHHGQPVRLRGEVLEWPPWVLAAASGLVEQLAHLFALPPLDLPASGESDLSAASWLVAGLTNLADWVGSQPDEDGGFPYHPEPVALDAYWAIARERAVRAVERAGLVPARAHGEASVRALVPGGTATPLQAATERCALPEGPSLFLVEDTTGSGKTEAALLLAHRLILSGRGTGLYVALPTMATASAMYARVAAHLPRLFELSSGPSLILAHSASHLPPALLALGAHDLGEASAGASASRWFADHRKAALHAQIGVGTVDQALLGVLPVRHGVLRLTGLSEKVLVLDEVHAYDPYVRQLLATLLHFHAAHGGSAILLSATLPAAMRRELLGAFSAGLGASLQDDAAAEPFPALTVLSAAGVRTEPCASAPGRRRETLIHEVHAEDEVLSELTRAADAGGCACWIRNTVAEAQAAHAAVATRLGAERAHLFHARLCLGHRLEREREVLARFGPQSSPAERAGHVLIATQVVEQSLDLDFDMLVTDLAPIDLVIQRAGRFRRHPRAPDGRRAPEEQRDPQALLVHTPPWTETPDPAWPGGNFAGTLAVYRDPRTLWRTQRELRRAGAIRLPEGARGLVEGVYGPCDDLPAGLDAGGNRAEGERRAHADLGRYNALRFEQGYAGAGETWLADVRTPTRLGEPSRTWLLVDADTSPPRPLVEAEGGLAAALSAIEVREGLIAPETAPGDEDGPRPLPLHWAGNEWVGEGVASGGKRIRIRYHQGRGLSVEGYG